MISSLATRWKCQSLTLITRFMGPIWGQQDPGGPHVGPMNLAIWVDMSNQREVPLVQCNFLPNFWPKDSGISPMFWHVCRYGVWIRRLCVSGLKLIPGISMPYVYNPRQPNVWLIMCYVFDLEIMKYICVILKNIIRFNWTKWAFYHHQIVFLLRTVL